MSRPVDDKTSGISLGVHDHIFLTRPCRRSNLRRISAFDREIGWARIRIGRPSVAKACETAPAKDSSGWQPECDWRRTLPFPPNHHERQAPAIVVTQQPPVDRPLKTVRQPGKR